MVNLMTCIFYKKETHSLESAQSLQTKGIWSYHKDLPEAKEITSGEKHHLLSLQLFINNISSIYQTKAKKGGLGVETDNRK